MKTNHTTSKTFHFLFFNILALTLVFCQRTWAYPDFIGYGYSTCITCHYNGLGGGALNDYGRALFATEITARDIYPKNMDEKKIGAQSGFLGSSAMPWWIRPGLKYRGLWFRTNPGSNNAQEKFINMQEDINLNFFADKKQTVSLISTISYDDQKPIHLPPHSNIKPWDWYLKESYIRWKINNNLWVYAGQMDKAFGIRNIDHTGFNRSFGTSYNSQKNLGQFDQSLGTIIHLTYSDWDLAANAFLGNIYELDSEKQKGLSLSGEYQFFEKFKMGASLLSSENDLTKWNLVALTSRLGLSKGSSIIAEWGFKQQTNKSDSSKLVGSYLWVESLISLWRGYNLLSVIESNKTDLNSASPENLKWSLGAMVFPLPRTELRFMAVNHKTYQDGQGNADLWQLQSQLHVSY